MRIGKPTLNSGDSLTLQNSGFTYSLTPPSLSGNRAFTFPSSNSSTGQILRAINSSGGSGWNSRAEDYILIVDEKAAGTDGGTATSGSWTTRTVNTEKADTSNHASISSNQITLAAGTYRCEITCPAVGVDQHKARLRNITDGSTTLVGTSEYSNSTAGTQSNSQIVGRFTISSTKVFEIQHRFATTLANNGLGVNSNFGEVEVYTIAKFWREAV